MGTIDINHPAFKEPWKWRIMSSLWMPEGAERVDDVYRDWLHENSDSHSHRELLIPVKGRCLSALNGKIYDCEPGTFFLFGKGDVHPQGYPPKADGLEHFWVSFMGADAVVRRVRVRRGRFRDIFQRSCVIGGHETTRNVARCWDEIASGAGDGTFNRLKMIAALAALLYYLLENVNTFMKSGSEERQIKVVETVMKHIDRTAGKNVSLDQMARISGYSKYHFLRVFKLHSGLTAHEYVDKARLEKTRELEAAGSLKKEIAEELGFSCSAAFSHWRRSIKRKMV